MSESAASVPSCPLALAGVLKRVHADLRQQCQQLEQRPDGDAAADAARSAWLRHTRSSDLLSAYAASMQRLATGAWQRGPASQSRIRWIRRHLRSYFQLGDHARIRERLARKAAGLDPGECRIDAGWRIKVLDVGSCFNPLISTPTEEDDADEEVRPQWLKVTAVDLAPAPTDSERLRENDSGDMDNELAVKKCDFLTVEVGGEREIMFRQKASGTMKGLPCEVTRLPVDYYDSVVFCLLLEYLPLPQMRHEACRRARDVLKTNGLLVIVTPDSNHQSKNVRVIRSWKICLSLLGFARVYYEKLPHVHCMAFRKLDAGRFAEFCRDDAEREAKKMGLDLTEIDPVTDLMIIPQDRTTAAAILFEEEQAAAAAARPSDEDDSEEVQALFEDLPCGF